MAAKKATKAALDVKEAAVDIRYDLEASENVKKSSKGHCRTYGVMDSMVDMDHMVGMVPWATMGKKNSEGRFLFL